ncbi:hypothetical protein DH2020_030401 [Rehmannia glutinosa]|uniref:Uncharacterized protein n=1 Tax=Rehmannia glutinosa TaxID=99300 RepID=A0ABR0VP29_REHGL
MRTLCPNLDREDALDTVLEVPIPEEMFASNKHNKSWQNMKSWVTMRPHVERANNSSVLGGRGMEIQFLLGVIGAPLIPLPIQSDRTVNYHNIKGHPIERSMAKYIVQQYIAASGGEHALNSIDNMYAMGKVKMAASEFVAGSEDFNITKLKNMKKHGEIGCKISAGSDGKVAWRQTPWQQSHASRGPPRPLRRSLQGLDPRSTANLFSNSICIGEKTINNEDCFVLKLEAEPSALMARSSSNVEIMRHTVWGCFSQRTGLLVQLEDSHLLRINSPGNDVYWETTMESLVQDYRTINGVNIAHGGRTTVSLLRFGEDSEHHSRTRMEEVWSIEEVDFNVKGLSMDCFLAPGDLRKEDEGCGVVSCGDIVKDWGLKCNILTNSSRIGGGRVGAKVVAIDEDNLELFETDEEL